MKKTRTPQDLGFTPQDAAMFSSMGGEEPDPFDLEFHRHLEKLGVVEHEHGIGFGEFPTAMDATDTQNAQQMARHEAISDISEGAKPPIPSPGQKPMTDVAVPPTSGTPMETPKKKAKGLPSKTPDWNDLK
jgi:hypothetical protein